MPLLKLDLKSQLWSETNETNDCPNYLLNMGSVTNQLITMTKLISLKSHFSFFTIS